MAIKSKYPRIDSDSPLNLLCALAAQLKKPCVF